jgi:polar amino acid transport system permease protein
VKRSQRRRLNHLAMYAILIAAVAVLAAVADWGAVKTEFLDGASWKSFWPDIITIAAKNTIKYTAIAFAGGLVMAIALALMKLSPVAGYRWLATAYIEFFRGLPALVVIIFMAFGVPVAFGWSPPGGPIGAGVIALIIVSSAYMAETLRAGIQAVPKGQEEASRSLGMSGARTMVSVTLPQAIRIVIPPLTNEFVLLLKDTSLLIIVGQQASQVDLTAFGENALTTNANPSSLLAIALVYLAIALPMTRLVAYLESRTKRAR